MNVFPEVEKKSQVLPSPTVRQQPVTDPPFFLVSSSGPAADDWSDMFGLYRKTEEIEWAAVSTGRCMTQSMKH